MRRLESLRIELKDISETVYDYLDRVESDPARLAKVTARMNLLYDAIKHFKVSDEAGLRIFTPTSGSVLTLLTAAI